MGSFTGQSLTCIRGERRVFADLDFALGPGEALLVTGPNGSGKSSLLRLMAGLMAPALGRIAWDGEDIRADPVAHFARFHYVGHLDAVKPVLSVTENLALWARLRGRHVAEANRALDRLGLAALAALPARMLSAGQRRRLNLARLLAAPAELWLLDEPTTALDASSVAVLAELIGEQRATGGRVVLTTHGALDVPSARSLVMEGVFAEPVDLFDWREAAAR
jgi:heme exporter protein A